MNASGSIGQRSTVGSQHTVTTLSQLIDNGVHFGHQTRRWNPKMKRFIFTERNGIYIIDLLQSLSYIDRAYEFVRATAEHGGTVLFVGTKKQAQKSIAEHATRVGQPYVNERWLGGMLTNFQTVAKRIQRMKELEEINFEDVAGSGYTKKELLLLKRELTKLETNLGGIRNLTKAPSVLWVVDTKKEHLAIDEAKKLNIPVVAILDTNCDPDEVDFPIPGNDDSIRSVSLLTRIVADAVAQGLIDRTQRATGAAEAQEEPVAEWERELLEGSAQKGPAGSEPLAGRRTDKGRPISADPHHLVLAAVDHPLSLHEVELLSNELGLRFRKMWDARQWVIGSTVLNWSDEDPLILRAVRHWDRSPGVEVELAWAGTRPPAAVIIEQRARVQSTFNQMDGL